MLAQAAFRLALLAAGQLGWALDEVTAPGWTEATMTGPLFILGHQRSGTTFLHRLLAQDRTHGRALVLHEMLLPATSLQRAFARLGDLDRLLFGGAGDRGLRRLQDRLFGPMDDIHRLRFHEVEEDELVLWSIFEGIMCANDAPSATALSALDDLRHFESWSPRRRARALGWYRACLLKKVQREPGPPGEPVWVVSKNPAFTHKVAALRSIFPEARFVYLVRNPLEAIPSRLSMIRAIWRQRFSGFERMTPAHVETILADSLRIYRAAERDLPGLPPGTAVTLRYEELVADPRLSVLRIYRELGLPGPDAHLHRALDRARLRVRSHVSRHDYGLEELGLDEARLRSELAPVFARFGF